MNFQELEYLTAIARCGSLSAAAKELFVSQPTLTKCLQRVEAETGLPLFEHIGRRMVPTYAGKRYLHHAEFILAEKKAMETELRDISHSDQGVLTVGMPHFRCSYTLDEILPSFSKKYPGILFNLVEASSAELDQKLLQGDVDIAVYITFRKIEGLTYKVFHQDKPYCIFAKGDPLERKAAKEGCIHLKDLNNRRIIIQSSSQRLGQYVLSKFAEHRITPSHIMQNTNLRASSALAANGYGYAFAYGEMLKYMNLPEDCNIYPVQEFDLFADVSAAWRDTIALPEYAKYFIELAEKYSKI